VKKKFMLLLSVWTLAASGLYSDDKTVALVGRKAVLESEVRRCMQEDRVDYRTALSRMITQKLLLVAAEEEKVQITREELRQEVAAIRKRLGGEQAWRQKLKENNFSYEGFLKNLEDNLKVRAFLAEKIGREVKVSAGEVLQASKQFQTQPLYYLKGKDFTSREEADNFYRAWNPGKISELEDVGWLAHDEIKPAVQAVVTRTAPGQLTEPVMVETRWHVFVVTEVKEKSLPREMMNRVREELYQKKYAQAFSNLLEQLQKKIPVRVFVAEK